MECCLQVSACTPNWQSSLAEELSLVSNPVLPLARDPGSQFRKESAKLLSQLSQLSFQELEDITLSLDVAPAKPPPPRPAPPGRPPPPPKRPSAPPRPGPPPSRPEPPKTKPTCELQSSVPAPPQKPNDPEHESKAASEVTKTGGGFSDLFSAPPDPFIAMDIPISLSEDSLVSFAASGEATPAPTKPPLPTEGSIEYPINYEPRLSTDSGSCKITTPESPPASASPTSQESPQHKKLPPAAVKRNISNSSSTETESGTSTPTNKERPGPPQVPSRPPPRDCQGGPPTGPPPGPPPAGPPPGPPPRLPSRPAAGPPPPVPRR